MYSPQLLSLIQVKILIVVADIVCEELASFYGKLILVSFLWLPGGAGRKIFAYFLQL